MILIYFTLILLLFTTALSAYFTVNDFPFKHLILLILLLISCFSFYLGYQNEYEKHLARMAAFSEEIKNANRQDDVAHKNEFAEWVCVTEDNKKICLKRGTKKWY